jgi:anti-sigma regulatory factor (Ser/Thr protein kinase)
MDDLPLDDALKYVDGSRRNLIREDVVRPETKAVTRNGEEYLRESPVYHDSFFQSLGISKRFHTKIWDAISLAFENAFLRGNMGDPKKAIIIRVYEGLEGKVVQVEDLGKGFDYHSAIKNLRQGVDYATGSGRGLRALKDANLLAGYEGKGNIINIVVLNKDLQ